MNCLSRPRAEVLEYWSTQEKYVLAQNPNFYNDLERRITKIKLFQNEWKVCGWIVSVYAKTVHKCVWHEIPSLNTGWRKFPNQVIVPKLPCTISVTNLRCTPNRLSFSNLPTKSRNILNVAFGVVFRQPSPGSLSTETDYFDPRTALARTK